MATPNTPAFPVPITQNTDACSGFIMPEQFTHGGNGITVRDYFAAKVAQGLCAYHGTNGHGVAGMTQTSPDVVAERAYEVAECLMIQREKN